MRVWGGGGGGEVIARFQCEKYNNVLRIIYILQYLILYPFGVQHLCTIMCIHKHKHSTH